MFYYGIGMNTIDTSDFAKDDTVKFGNSVSAAQKHFASNPHIPEHVMIYSNSHRKWYQNSISEPSHFTEIPDVSKNFGFSVRNAQEHFKTNLPIHIVIYSNRTGNWWHNSLVNPISFIPTSFQPPDPQLPVTQLPVARPQGNKTPIFVFDFDMTLTTEHTNGHPDIQKRYITKEQEELVGDMFTSIKFNFPNSIIVILSRGYRVMIDYYMQNVYKELYEKIGEIIGAELGTNIGGGSDEQWAVWKVDWMKKLCELYGTEDIIFFDDTQINVKHAIASRFKNSYLIKKQSTNTTSVYNEYNAYLETVYQSKLLTGEEYYMTAKDIYINFKYYQQKGGFGCDQCD